MLISVGRAERSLEPQADWSNQTESTWHNHPWIYPHQKTFVDRVTERRMQSLFVKVFTPSPLTRVHYILLRVTRQKTSAAVGSDRRCEVKLRCLMWFMGSDKSTSEAALSDSCDKDDKASKVLTCCRNSKWINVNSEMACLRDTLLPFMSHTWKQMYLV